MARPRHISKESDINVEPGHEPFLKALWTSSLDSKAAAISLALGDGVEGRHFVFPGQLLWFSQKSL